MKILIIGNNGEGIYKFRAELIQQMVADKNDVTVLVPKDNFENDFVKLGANIITYPLERRSTNPIKDLKLYFYYKKIIKSINPDRVLTYTIKPNVYAGYACRRLKIKYFPTITGLGLAFEKGKLLSTISLMLLKIGLKGSDCVFFQNKQNLDFLVNHNVVKEDNTKLVNGSGVNTDINAYCDYNDDGTIKILFVGRICKDKGIVELYDAAKRIIKTYDNVQFHLLGYIEEDCKNIIEEAINDGTFIFHGSSKNVTPFYAMSSAVIMPSYHEGMSNVLLEAGSCGRPLLASNIFGCKEIIIDNETGFLFEPKNSQDIYDKLTKFISLDENTRKTMGQKSRNYIVKNFERKNIVKSYLDKIYK